MGYYNFFILLFSGILAITTSLLVYYNNKLFNVNKGMLKYQEKLLKLNVIAILSKQLGNKEEGLPNYSELLKNAINKAIPEDKEEILEWFKK